MGRFICFNPCVVPAPPGCWPPHIAHPILGRTRRAIDKWAALADVFVTPAAHVRVLQSFFLWHIWHLFLLLALSGLVRRRIGLGRRPDARVQASSWSRALRAAVAAALTAFTTAADASVRGMHSLRVMNGVTRAFPSCSRNTLRLFRLPGIQSGLISLHITNAV